MELRRGAVELDLEREVENRYMLDGRGTMMSPRTRRRKRSACSEIVGAGGCSGPDGGRRERRCQFERMALG